MKQAVKLFEEMIKIEKENYSQEKGGEDISSDCHLKSLIKHNRGFMQIVSDDGFYEFSNNNEIDRLFEGKFPGTVINLQFRTDDSAAYSLWNE